MLTQLPQPGSFHLQWAGDLFAISLTVQPARPGRAVFRTTIGRAAIRRQELIESTESDEPVLACEWHDLPMREEAPGHYTIRIPLTEVGLFAGKACFFPEGETVPLWPDGGNLQFKVEPAHTLCANTMYTAFVRQFGPGSPRPDQELAELDRAGYTVIPPSGTFRDVIGRLDTILGTLRFRILQLLPIFPTPTTFARMGRYGCPFAALDFLSVDPALAVFDPHATPLDQFRELVDAVHRRGATLYLDLPANHTGWAATLQIHHPEWYRHRDDGAFKSPGAWGVTWEDLVELDYTDPGLRTYMAEVFLFWCRQGVDGFRCDAGYMIPIETWRYIVARIRAAYPDTVFLLEGLGGKLETTEQLLIDANLNWAYSELFQTENREAMEWYLPQAIERSERFGPLIHFAETHDNNRLAAKGQTYARMRVALSALLSNEGAFGMANGVEWFATEKIDVHGSSSLNWDAPDNQVQAIARLNALLAEHPSFHPGTHLRMIQHGGGNVLAVLRERTDAPLLILVNLDCGGMQTVHWASDAFPYPVADDLLSGETIDLHGRADFDLPPGAVLCLAPHGSGFTPSDSVTPQAVLRQCRNLMAMRIREALLRLREREENPEAFDPDDLGRQLTRDPSVFCAAMNETGFAPCVHWTAPQDLHRTVPVPDGFLLFLEAEVPFHAELTAANGQVTSGDAIPLDSGAWFLYLPTPRLVNPPDGSGEYRRLTLTRHLPDGTRRETAELLILPPAAEVTVPPFVSGHDVRSDLARCSGVSPQPARAFSPFHAVLSNGAGAMAYVRAAWGKVRSQYDCLLGVNPDPNVPADKFIFWTRCLAWVRHRGYSQEITAACLARFAADPAGRFAEWSFKVPCGMGHWVPIRFRLDMAPAENRVRLTVSRETAPDALPAEDEITVILRPHIEWRSFHTKTKAYLGAEQALPAAIRAESDGFRFDLPGALPDLGIFLKGGQFHPGNEWRYSLPHPEESERGL
ncbi:MAG: glycogen debranching enzyme N-terminal domain-containing protein, partial [Kiritimatiellae bacterium]|nr:glycogen debranching enzyme N-terminal domain-containing protein [Kiritimatiellia bacterium]